MSPEIKFTENQIKFARRYNKVHEIFSNAKAPKHKTFKCSIDGYVLRIGKYKVTKTWAIKFAKWILKSFEKEL